MSERVHIAVICSLLFAAVGGAAEEQAIRIVDRASVVATINLRAHREEAPEVESEEVEPPPMPLPDHLPVPIAFARRTHAPEPLNAFPLLKPAIESSSIARSFLALTDNNATVPPDTSGAVGPNHLIVALNTQIRFQNRTGGELLTTSLRIFFEGIRSGVRRFDPHVAYDPRTGHWLICATTDQKISTAAQPTASAIAL